MEFVHSNLFLPAITTFPVARKDTKSSLETEVIRPFTRTSPNFWGHSPGHSHSLPEEMAGKPVRRCYFSGDFKEQPSGRGGAGTHSRYFRALHLRVDCLSEYFCISEGTLSSGMESMTAACNGTRPIPDNPVFFPFGRGAAESEARELSFFFLLLRAFVPPPRTEDGEAGGGWEGGTVSKCPACAPARNHHSLIIYEWAI